MANGKRLDDSEVIIALLSDVHTLHRDVFNTRALRNTTRVVQRRVLQEGISFLTKTLPRLGKCLDKALTGSSKMNCVSHRFKAIPNTELPSFLGEFFIRIFHPDGTVLPNPCINSIRVLRDILYLYYKYKLPFTDEQTDKVILDFKKAEKDLIDHSPVLADIRNAVEKSYSSRRRSTRDRTPTIPEIAREARIRLQKLFSRFDPLNIIPKHGPGAVATKQKLWAKFEWTNVSDRITTMYPLDQYYYCSLGHVCDEYKSITGLGTASLPAKVILVPKDSRGPRLISCEPVDFQWIQQGLSSAVVELVERHPLTKWNVFFTDQKPNQRGALLGSSTGRYATLDLKEASDRISTDLVRLLFPSNLVDYLLACRTSSTVLPNGEELPLTKFAPMGSALCFPILALSVWAILTAAAPDADTRESVLVYGDDVIVPTAYAVNAIERLESFGLKVNRDKSCTQGFFRESCGVDAFRGHNVTPVRLRTVWSSHRCPNSYVSWIAYANQFYDRGYYQTYWLITNKLLSIYRWIPSEDMRLSCPSLRQVPDQSRPKTKRWNKSLQKLEFKSWDLKSPSIRKEINGWSMLLRYFTEGSKVHPLDFVDDYRRALPRGLSVPDRAFSVGLYTRRRTSMLVRRWR